MLACPAFCQPQFVESGVDVFHRLYSVCLLFAPHSFSSHHCPRNIRVLDLLRWSFEQIIRQHDQVGIFPGGDRSPILLHEVRECAVDRVCANRRVQIDCLRRHPTTLWFAVECIAPASRRLRNAHAYFQRAGPTALAHCPVMSGAQCRGCMQATTPSCLKRGMSFSFTHSIWISSSRRSRGPFCSSAYSIASSAVRIPRSPME